MLFSSNALGRPHLVLVANTNALAATETAVRRICFAVLVVVFLPPPSSSSPPWLCWYYLWWQTSICYLLYNHCTASRADIFIHITTISTSDYETERPDSWLDSFSAALTWIYIEMASSVVDERNRSPFSSPCPVALLVISRQSPAPPFSQSP